MASQIAQVPEIQYAIEREEDRESQSWTADTNWASQLHKRMHIRLSEAICWLPGLLYSSFFNKWYWHSNSSLHESLERNKSPSKTSWSFGSLQSIKRNRQKLQEIQTLGLLYRDEAFCRLAGRWTRDGWARLSLRFVIFVPSGSVWFDRWEEKTGVNGVARLTLPLNEMVRD